ncbi:2Fe-2S iron-sulfur cluster-binding protein [Eubacterium barkeri]|uniref:2Fe-2S iron-sulfur cluster binding domain-containing protein n=1 Tax=Eubacterium barkeri TaxID=1528 RepID=A0A1H3EJP6_EUBBA|nr:2Fe-2S iron-sulfur cluster-binding protein [Eubacterium barkeri]SDX78428.1 2Fe-2S iron-sulfur cluster binding domain-containing protein [Eubacterium barkeri]
MKIHFPVYEQTIQIEMNSTVADACRQSGHPLNQSCSGRGCCKKCTIRIREKGLLMDVLACQYPLSDEMEIFISPKGSAVSIRPFTIPAVIPAPRICNYPVLTDALRDIPADCLSKTLNHLLPRNVMPLSPTVLTKAAALMTIEGDSILNVIMAGDMVIDLTSSPEPLEIFGIALAQQGSSIQGILFNLSEGIFIDSTTLSGHFESHLEKNPAKLIHQLCTRNNILESQIYNLLCSSTGFLKSEHFLSLPININPQADIGFLPSIGKGGDSTLIASLSCIPDDSGLRLLLRHHRNSFDLALGENSSYLIQPGFCSRTSIDSLLPQCLQLFKKTNTCPEDLKSIILTGVSEISETDEVYRAVGGALRKLPAFSEMCFELAMDLEIIGLQRALLSLETLFRCADIAENSRIL